MFSHLVLGLGLRETARAVGLCSSRKRSGTGSRKRFEAAVLTCVLSKVDSTDRLTAAVDEPCGLWLRALVARVAERQP